MPPLTIPTIAIVLLAPRANSVPELMTVPLTITVPPVAVSTVAPLPTVPPLRFNCVPLVTSTSEPDTIVPPWITLVPPIVSITALLPFACNSPPEIFAFSRSSAVALDVALTLNRTGIDDRAAQRQCCAVPTLMRPEFAIALPLVASSVLAPLTAFTVAPLAMISAPLTCPSSRSICTPEPSTTPPVPTVKISPSTMSVALLPIAETLPAPDTTAPLAIVAAPPLLTVMPFAVPPERTANVPPLKTVVLDTRPPSVAVKRDAAGSPDSRTTFGRNQFQECHRN